MTILMEDCVEKQMIVGLEMSRTYLDDLFLGHHLHPR